MEELVMGGNSLRRRITPAEVLQDWLLKSTDSLRMRPERDIILMARLELAYQLKDMDNGDIAWEIHKWAETHSFLPVNWQGTPGSAVPANAGAAPVRAGDPEILERLKDLMKTFGSLSTALTWVGDGVSAGITVTGATVTAGKGDAKVTATAGWNRSLELKTAISGMSFA